jgi:ADP-ribosylglycohydrolase
MLLEMAIGDSYGSVFEFADRKFIRENNDVKGYVLKEGRTPGKYTDDTQMAIAIAEAVLADDVFDKLALAGWFVTCYKRDPREGYARGFKAFLDDVSTGQEFLDRISPKSDKSGSAMRAAPLGVLATPTLVRRAAAVQSSITHDTPFGIRSAMVAALMSYYFIHNKGPARDLGKWLETEVPGGWNNPWNGKVGTKAIQCVRAAITAVVRNTKLTGILHDAIAFSGDVDTVAAIALAAAASSKDIQQDLPTVFFDNLENGPYGREYIKKLDKSLAALNYFVDKNSATV